MCVWFPRVCVQAGASADSHVTGSVLTMVYTNILNNTPIRQGNFPSLFTSTFSQPSSFFLLFPPLKDFHVFSLKLRDRERGMRKKPSFLFLCLIILLLLLPCCSDDSAVILSGP